MTTHELVITTSIEPLGLDEELRKYLQREEIVSGPGFELHLDIENTGRNKFPGGKIATISFVGAVTEYYWPGDVNIPEIAANKSERVSKTLGLVAQRGAYSFRWEIEPSDNGEMLYRRGRGWAEMKGKYVSQFYAVVDRRQLEIISLLHKIVNRLPKE